MDDAHMLRLSSDSFIVMNVPSDEVMKVNGETVMALQSQGYGGVYVSLSKDYLSIASALGQAGADLGRIRFVDAASRMYGVAPVDSPEVVYVDGPLSIDALIAGVAASVRSLKEKKRFVLLDSLTTLLLYNSPEVTVAFSKALKDLCKKERAAGVVILAYRDALNKDLIRELEKSGVEMVAGEEVAS